MPWYGGAVRCTVWFGYANGRKCFFIEPHSAADFFGRDRLYGYADDAERFAFFSKAALEFVLRADKRPDVIHCHDWQTGLVPVLLYGVDYDAWNPETDPFLPARYSIDSTERKHENKTALRDRFWTSTSTSATAECPDD